MPPANPLLRRPAVADNATMQTELPKADPPKRKRRWFQFSLRTLLIFTLICAVAAGWLGKSLGRKRREQEAADAIVKLTGNVRYDYQKANGAKPPGPEWLRKLLCEKFFSEVTEVSGFGQFETKIDAGLENLKEFSNLETLGLNKTKVTDAGLVNLQGLTTKLTYASRSVSYNARMS
jgi:hypothetical protein